MTCKDQFKPALEGLVINTLKELGAPSLKWVADRWGCTVRNLEIKFKDKPEQFDIIVSGTVKLYKGDL